MTPLSIDVRSADARHVVIAVAGEIDMATAPQLAAALGRYDECDVTVDLAEVEFLDSSGLSVLVHARKRLLQGGHTLRTVNERRNVLVAITAAGLVTTFHEGVAEDPGRP
jgi:anti-sigma B factor antagonist